MKHQPAKLFACVVVCLAFPQFLLADEGNPIEGSHELSVMAWNIWHGGKEDGEDIGPKRVVDVIKSSGADIVAMQETYGSGERISKALGYHFHPRGTNVSIHSRYPIVEDISVFEEFKVVGGLIELPSKRKIAFYSIWLPYNKEIWAEGTRDPTKPNEMRKACTASADDLLKIRKQIDERLKDKKYRGVPIIIAGDFNSMSHLDYRECYLDQHEFAMNWDTSRVMTDAGFRDSYRELHPEVDRIHDRTWTPRFPEQQQDRIDYIYYRGDAIAATDSEVIDTHAEKFPSDHAVVVTKFLILPANAKTESLRVASYNIKHGQGNDTKVDLRRTAALIDNLNADIIGLQEIDRNVSRSGNENQPKLLAKATGMSSAFGAFMPYGGGEYGLAILSRFPITNETVLRLPDGNEPRVALACEVELPSGEQIVAVNVHFDWVRDDKFRFAQAEVVAEHLGKLDKPYVLLGDFNDVRNSRTLDLLSQSCVEAEKPSDDQFTFSATKPAKEIDFLFASPESRWSVGFCKVLDGKVTSDHRPVLALFQLRKTVP